jgi:hypothetical protein
MRQVDPSQCSTSGVGREVEFAFCSPTAHTSLAETAATPYSSLSPDPAFGLFSTLQDLPFHFSISVEKAP